MVVRVHGSIWLSGIGRRDANMHCDANMSYSSPGCPHWAIFFTG